MTPLKTTLPTTVATVLTVVSFTLISSSTAVAASKRKPTAPLKATHKSSAKPASRKPSPAAKHPAVLVIAPTPKTNKIVASARPQTALDPDDENTINVRLETGDEELDHTQGGDDPISRSRAALESNLGPRSGRTRSNSNSKLVSRALSYRGARYRFGATGGGGAFDCSGFVQHLMRTEGVSIARTAGEQFHGGRAIGRESLQPGDLVFFQNTYKHGISHVGMYVGDGLFVHAASQKRGVVMDPLDLPYYNGKYAGARRYK